MRKNCIIQIYIIFLTQGGVIAKPLSARGEVLEYDSGRDVPLQVMKWHPSIYHFSKEKVTHPYTNHPDFETNFDENYQIFPIFVISFKQFAEICTFSTKICANLAQILENFEKTTHSYTKFCIEKGVIAIPGGRFCDPCWRHIPICTFVLSTPGGAHSPSHTFFE